MSLPVTHGIWLDEAEVCAMEHLIEVSGLSLEEVEDLVVSGVIWPAGATRQSRRFHLVHVATVRQARRLRDDFELDSNGLALAMTLLQRIGVLEQALSMHPGPAADD
ncbi:MAG: chaperone modulator CbpM [Pseudomonadota bacterium]